MRDAARRGDVTYRVIVRTDAALPITVHTARATAMRRILEGEGFHISGCTDGYPAADLDPEMPREAQNHTAFLVQW